MNKLVKQAIKSIISGILFAVCYLVITFIMGDKINIVNILSTTIMYVVLLFVVAIIAPHLKKLFGNKEK